MSSDDPLPTTALYSSPPRTLRTPPSQSQASSHAPGSAASVDIDSLDPDGYYRSYTASLQHQSPLTAQVSHSSASHRHPASLGTRSSSQHANSASSHTSAGTPVKRRGTSGIQEGSIGDRIKAFNQINGGASPRSVGLVGPRNSSVSKKTSFSQQASGSRRQRGTVSASGRNPQVRSHSSPNPRTKSSKDGGKLQLLFGEILDESEIGSAGQGISAIPRPSVMQPTSSGASPLISIAERSHEHESSNIGDHRFSKSAPDDSDVFASDDQSNGFLRPRIHSSEKPRRRSDVASRRASPSRAPAMAGAAGSGSLRAGRDAHSRRQPLSPSYVLPSRRYSPKRVNHNPQTLDAIVHASPTRTSPALRSSRPRQPVAAASTAASRARLAERFEKQSAATQSRPRADNVRVRPHIPGGVDVAARRARLQDKLSVSNPSLGSDLEGAISASAAIRRAKSRDQLPSSNELERTVSAPMPHLDLEGTQHYPNDRTLDHGDGSDASEEYATPATRGSIEEPPSEMEGTEGATMEDQVGDGVNGRPNNDFYTHIRRLRDSTTTDAAHTTAIEDFLSDDGETIQMFLGKTPNLPEWTEPSTVPPIPRHYLLPTDDTLETESIFPDDSVSVAFGHNPRRVPGTLPFSSSKNSQPTLDSAARSQINRALEEYYAPTEGAVSSDQDQPVESTDESDGLRTGDITPDDVQYSFDWMAANSADEDRGPLLSQAVYNPLQTRAVARKSLSTSIPLLHHHHRDPQFDQSLADEPQSRIPEVRAHVHSLSNATLESDATVRDEALIEDSTVGAVSPVDYPVDVYHGTHQDISSTRAQSSGPTLGAERFLPRIAHDFDSLFDADRQPKRSDSLAPDSRSGDTVSMKSQASSVSYDASITSLRPNTSPVMEREFAALTLSPSNRASSASTNTTDARDPSIETATTSVDSPISRRPVSLGSKQKSLEKELNERRNCIRELVDTEASYSRDMFVMHEIYMGTAPSVLSIEDTRTLFGNLGTIKDFSIEFLDALRQGAASVYSLNRVDLTGKRSSRSTSTSGNTDSSAMTFSAASEKERVAMDARTSVGRAFLKHLSSIEKIYTEWIVKTNDAANARLRELQQKPTTKMWLDECYKAARDMTQAWSLDALLIKPAQRLMKYPLLLTALLKSTRPDHPDYPALKQASEAVLLLTSRINDSKKRAELVDQAMNRKRKDSDVKISVGKLLNRRTEKFKQHVGLSVVTDDQEYQIVEQKHGGHYFQLQVVMRDVEKYVEDCQTSVAWLVGFVKTLIEFMQADQQVRHAEMESNWIKISQTVQDLQMIALQDHISRIRSTVIEPIQKLWNLYAGPKKMMDKRKSKFVDHVRYKALTQRGEQPDKKLQKEEDEYCAVNELLKEELPKLYTLTKKLMRTCLLNFIELQADWQGLVRRKLSLFGDDEEKITLAQFVAKLEAACTSDHAEQDLQVMALGICNGSTLAEVQNFLSPVPSHTNADGFPARPRQATLTGEQRSISSPSVNDHASAARPYVPRQYDTFSPMVTSPSTGDFRQGPTSPYEGSFHTRARSTYSGREPVTPRTMSGYLTPQTHINGPSHTSAGYAEHSDALMQSLWEAEAGGMSPRPSARAPPMPNEIQSSARSVHSQHSRQSGHDRRVSGIFSSALPMSDGPPSPVPVPSEPEIPATVLYLAASLFEFNIDGSRREGGFPYLRYVPGEIFDVLAQKGELWLARNQDDPAGLVGWIWEKHFARIMPDDE